MNFNQFIKNKQISSNLFFGPIGDTPSINILYLPELDTNILNFINPENTQNISEIVVPTLVPTFSGKKIQTIKYNKKMTDLYGNVVSRFTRLKNNSKVSIFDLSFLTPVIIELMSMKSKKNVISDLFKMLDSIIGDYAKLTTKRTILLIDNQGNNHSILKNIQQYNRLGDIQSLVGAIVYRQTSNFYPISLESNWEINVVRDKKLKQYDKPVIKLNNGIVLNALNYKISNKTTSELISSIISDSRNITKTGINNIRDSLAELSTHDEFRELDNKDKLEKIFKEHDIKTFEDNSLENIKELLEHEHKVFSPSKIVGIDSININRQSYEFKHTFNDKITNTVKSFEKDKELGLKIHSVTSKTISNNTDYIRQFKINLSHDFGNTTKKKYTLTMNLPVMDEANDRYIRLGGANYILGHQLFDKPIIKKSNTTAKLTTHFSTINYYITRQSSLSKYDIINEFMINMEGFDLNNTTLTQKDHELLTDKFDSDLSTLKTKSLKYNQIIFDLSKDKFYTNGINTAEYKNNTIIWKKNTYQPEDIENVLYDIFNDISNTILSRGITVTTKEQLKMKLKGTSLTVFTFLLIDSNIKAVLDLINVKYSTDKTSGGKPFANVFILGDLTREQSLIVNGYEPKLDKILKLKSYNNKHINSSITKAYSCEGIIRNKNNIMDTTTSEILESEGITPSIEFISGIYIPELLFGPINASTTDLKNKRLRSVETISHAAFTQFNQALIAFKTRKEIYDDKITFDPNFVTKELLNTGMLQQTESHNPLSEVMGTMKITKSGIGNMKKNMIMLKERDLNKSQFKTISSTATNEYGQIGVNQTLTNGYQISDKFGSFIEQEFTNDKNGFEMLSPVESLKPFFEYDDTTRSIMGNQQSGQYVEIDNPDTPLIQTGYEQYMKHLTSSRFVDKAEQDGRVIDVVKNDHVTVEYSDGTTNKISVAPDMARTKRGIYVPKYKKINVQNGEKFKKGKTIANTPSFNNSNFNVGRNLVVAEMGYLGGNYEDGWAVSEDIFDKYKHKIVNKVTIVLRENTDIIINNINNEIGIGDTIIEVKTSEDIDFIGSDSERYSENTNSYKQVGDTTKYFSPGGNLIDYKITTDNYKNIKSKDEIKDVVVSKAHKIVKGLKGNVDKFIKLELMYETYNSMGNGTKFTLGNSGGKGTVQYQIPSNKKPLASETGLQIEFVATPLSIIGRKNPSILYSLYLGKCVYFLNKYVKNGFKGKSLNVITSNLKSIKSIVIKFYKLLDKTTNQTFVSEIELFFKSNIKTMLKLISNSDPLSNPLFPAIVPPFGNKLDINDVKMTAELLEIPLNEKVFVQETGRMTENAVPVGIMPVFLLEHFSKSMSSTRGSLFAKAQGITGQGRSGQKEGDGAIKSGLYDTYSLLSKSSYGVIKELGTYKSDAADDRRTIERGIIKTGKIVPLETTKTIDIKNEQKSNDRSVNLGDPGEVSNRRTQNYMRSLFIGAGIDYKN